MIHQGLKNSSSNCHSALPGFPVVDPTYSRFWVLVFRSCHRLDLAVLTSFIFCCIINYVDNGVKKPLTPRLALSLRSSINT
jgi:hypothetical protein